MLKNRAFWYGFAVAYLLVCFVPQVNFRSHLPKGGGQAG